MKNKGFTLIELLAVIVILAIVALIAAPIVINIINSSRENADMRSRELYAGAVQNAILKAQLDGIVLPDGTYTLDNSTGKICHVEQTNKCITPEVSGTKPYSFKMVISEGKIASMTIILKDGDQSYSSSEGGKLIASTEIQKSYREAVEAAIVAAGGDPDADWAAFVEDDDNAGPVDGDYYIDANGNLINVRTGDISSANVHPSITVNATKPYPKNGFIAIKGSKIVDEQYSDQDPICTYYEDYRAYKPSKDAPTPETRNSNTNGIHSIRKGARYVCKVNNTESYTFYIVTNNDSYSNGNGNFDLIMADFVGETTTWGTDVASGPVNVMQQLALRTAGWTNIPYINFNSNYYNEYVWNKLLNKGKSNGGYQSLSITDGVVTIKNNSGNSTTLANKTRARLLTFKEAWDDLSCRYDNNTCLSWLDRDFTYWMLDSDSNNQNADSISYTNNIVGISDLTSSRYVVPVISLPKTAMDWTHKVRAS